MKQVDPAIYSGVNRADRRRIARNLARAKRRRDEASKEARRLLAVIREPVPSVVFLPHTRPGADGNVVAAVASIQEAVSIPPLALMACAICHRPVPQCICGLRWE